MNFLTFLLLILFTNVSYSFSINDYLFLLSLLFIVNNNSNAPYTINDNTQYNSNNKIISPRKIINSNKDNDESIDMICSSPELSKQKNIISNSYDSNKHSEPNSNKIPQDIKLYNTNNKIPFEKESSITKHIDNIPFITKINNINNLNTSTSSFNNIMLINDNDLGNTLTIAITNLCSITGKLLLNTPQIIALKFDNNKIIYINKKYISFFSS